MELVIGAVILAIVWVAHTVLRRRQQARMYASVFKWSDARLLGLADEHFRARVRLVRNWDASTIDVYLRREGRVDIFCCTVSATPTGYSIESGKMIRRRAPRDTIELVNQLLHDKDGECDQAKHSFGGVGVLT